MAPALGIAADPLPSDLESLADRLLSLAPSDRRAVLRLVESRYRAERPALHPLSPRRLLASKGVVALGGDAVDDTRALYDG